MKAKKRAESKGKGLLEPSWPSKVSKMATTEEELERQKQKCSAAQTAFTKRANLLTSRVNALGEREMRSEWRNFKVEHSRVTDTGFEYATALREVNSEEAKRKAEDIDEKTAECDP